MIKLCDEFLNKNEGIYDYLLASNKFSWLTSDNFQDYNYEYYFLHSGEKNLSPLYLKLYTKVNCLQILSNIIINKYYDKWQKIYNALQIDYNPTEDFKQKETNESAKTIENIKKQSQNIENSDIYQRTRSEDYTSNKGTKVAVNLKSGNVNEVYGFNNEVGVNANSSNNNAIQETSGNLEENKTIDKNTISDKEQKTNITKGLLEDNVTIDTNNYKDTFKKEVNGNFGTHSIQKLLSEEISLRKIIFIDIVNNDIDTILASNLYRIENETIKLF